MKKRLIDYIHAVEDEMYQEHTHNQWQQILTNHVEQIRFFQHERLIHLIVTCFVGIVALLSLFFTLFQFSYGTFILTILLFILFIPYIFHYYFLENHVQYLYILYDRIWNHLKDE